METTLGKSGTSFATGKLAMPVWSTLKSTIESGSKSDTLCLGQTGSWGLPGRGGRLLEGGPSWFQKVGADWETGHTGIIEQGSEKRRGVCFAWPKAQ